MDDHGQPRRSDDARFLRRTLLVFGLGVLTLVLLLLLRGALEVLLLGFAGVLVGVFLNAPVTLLTRRTALPRPLALALTLVVLGALAVGGLRLLGPSLATQAAELAQALPSSLEQLRAMVRGWPAGAWLVEVVPERDDLAPSAARVLTGMAGTAAALGDVGAKLVYVVIIGLFLAANPATYRRGFLALFPRRARPRAREVVDQVGRTLQAWLLGQLLSMLVVATVVSLGLWAIGIPLALALGVIAGALEFIPVVGPVLAYLPAALVALTQGGDALLWATGFYLVVQQLEGNLLTPLVQRYAVDLPPALTVTGVFVGAATFGVLGMLVATPLLAVAVVLVKMLYVHDLLRDRVELPGGVVERSRPARARPSAARGGGA
jgi:predicted PurR-regulated permease PerM